MKRLTFLFRHYLGQTGRFFRLHVCCRLGWHGPAIGADGIPSNFCCWGCGHTFTPNPFKTWIVTLVTGEQFEVQAINEYHAGSMVVYGDGPWAVNGYTGEAMTPLKVHRGNIKSAVLKEA